MMGETHFGRFALCSMPCEIFKHSGFCWVKGFKISGLVGEEKTSTSDHKEYDHPRLSFCYEILISRPVNSFASSKKGLCLDRGRNKFDIYWSDPQSYQSLQKTAGE